MNKLFTILILCLSVNLFASDADYKRLNDPSYLVGYWPLSKDAKDYSGNGNHGVWSGTEAYQLGPYRKDVGEFNGSSSYVNTGYNPGPIGTLTALIKTPSTTTLGSNRYFIGAMQPEGYRLYIGVVNAAPLFIVGVQTFFGVAEFQFKQNSYYHIALAYSTTNWNFYVNGKLVRSATGTYTTATNSLYVGALNNDNNPANYYPGNVSNVRMYNAILSPSEIAALYKMEQFVPKFTMLEQPYDVLPDRNDPTLVGAWLNSATANSARDYSANNRHGTATSVNWNKVGGMFNGSSSRIAVGSTILNTNNFTLSFSVKLNAFGTKTIFNSEVSDNVNEIKIYTGASSGFNILYRPTVGTQVLLTDSSPVIGQWYRYDILVTLTNIALYNNSILVASNSIVNNLTAVANHNYIGSDDLSIGGGNYFSGLIKDFRVYSEAKSASWVAQEHKRSVPDNSLIFHLNNGRDISRFNRPITNYKVSTGSGPMRFNGVDSYLSTPDFIGTNDFTAMVWFRANGYGEIAGRILDNSKLQFNIESVNILKLSSDQASVVSVTSNYLFPQWNSVVITRSSNLVTFYRNGIQIGTPNQNAGTPTAATTLYIGNRAAGDRTFDGYLGPMLIFNRVLAKGEIVSWMKSTEP